MIKIMTRRVANIDGVDYPVYLSFPVSPNWRESPDDSEGHIIEMNGEFRLILSDHGTFILHSNIPFVDEDLDISFGPEDQQILQNFILEYKESITQTEEALAYLKSPKPVPVKPKMIDIFPENIENNC